MFTAYNKPEAALSIIIFGLGLVVDVVGIETAGITAQMRGGLGRIVAVSRNISYTVNVIGSMFVVMSSCSSRRTCLVAGCPLYLPVPVLCRFALV